MTRRPKLLVLTQYFPPEMGAPQARLSELTTRLKNLGWDVEVLTAMPNYPSGRIFDEYRGKWILRETVAGVNVTRVWLIPSQSPRTIPRMLCYVSFACSAFFVGARVFARPDVILVESPPLFLGLAAVLLSRRWNTPFVMNVSDLWPDSFVHMGRLTKRSIAYRVMKRLELYCYRKAAGVTGQSSGIVQAVQDVIPEVKSKLITNGVDVQRFGKAMADYDWRHKAGWDAKCVFVFAGLHGLAQGLDQVLCAAKRLRHRQDICFALIGDGPAKADLKKMATKMDLGNVQFFESQPRDRMPSILAAADVALVTLGALIHGAVPSKIYEAMGSELPILLVGEGEAAERVLSAKAGLAVRCSDSVGLVDAVLRLADNPAYRQELGMAGRKTAENTYSRDAIAGTLADFLHDIVGPNLKGG